MKRKSSRATPAKPPRLRSSFSRVNLKRAVAVARQCKLPLDRIIIDVDGSVSLLVGRADDTSRKNPWDEVLTNAAHEKRTA